MNTPSPAPLLRTAAALLTLQLLLSGCGGGGDLSEPDDMAGRLEAAHGGADGLRQFFDSHSEEQIRAELGRYGITVNAIVPGPIDTDIMGGQLSDERKQGMSADIPVQRVGQPQDLDTALLMLCANESHFINGAVIQADDGFGV